MGSNQALLVKKAREAFVGAEAKSSLMDFPMPAMLGVEDPVEALLLILEKVVTESIALNAEEDAQLRAYPTVPLSPLSPAPSIVSASPVPDQPVPQCWRGAKAGRTGAGIGGKRQMQVPRRTRRSSKSPLERHEPRPPPHL